MLSNNDFADEMEVDSARPAWHFTAILISSVCFLNIFNISDLVLNQYFGSGWAICTYIIFVILFALPIAYCQLKLGCQYRRSMLSLMDKFLPLGLVFGIASVVRNIVQLLWTSGVMTLCLSYIFFSVFPCDGKQCQGGTFMWGSCKETWSNGLCVDNVKRIYQGTTAEEHFFFNFVMQNTKSIDVSGEFPVWFDQRVGLNIPPHILTWILLAVCVLVGPRIFQYIMYAIAPVILIILISMLSYFGVKYSDSLQQRDEMMRIFYSNFSQRLPLVDGAEDKFSYEPRIWGIFSTFVNLSLTLNLWNGTFSAIGKWIGYGKKRKHLYSLVVVLPFLLLGQLNCLIFVFSLSSSFVTKYLRCPVAHQIFLPFILLPHVFSRFSSNTALPVFYFIGLFLQLLLSQSLLFHVTLDSVIEHLGRWRQWQQRSISTRIYPISAVLASLCFMLLSFPTIIRSGYYWIQFLHHFSDRLLVVVILGQTVFYIVAQLRSRRTKSEPWLLRLLFVILLAIIGLLSVAVFIWYIVDANSISPTLECKYLTLFQSPFSSSGNGGFFTQRRPPTNADDLQTYLRETLPYGTPWLPSTYRVLGWLLAGAPLLIGLATALVVVFFHSRSDFVLAALPDSSQSFSYADYLVSGLAKLDRSHHNKPPPEIAITTSLGGDHRTLYASTSGLGGGGGGGSVGHKLSRNETAWDTMQRMQMASVQPQPPFKNATSSTVYASMSRQPLVGAAGGGASDAGAPSAVPGMRNSILQMQLQEDEWDQEDEAEQFQQHDQQRSSAAYYATTDQGGRAPQPISRNQFYPVSQSEVSSDYTQNSML